MQDIIDYIPEQLRFGITDKPLNAQPAAKAEEAALEPLAKKVLAGIGPGEASLDAVVEALKIDVPQAANVLFELEVKGILACRNGLYSRSKF